MSLLKTFKDYLRLCKDKKLLIQRSKKRILSPSTLINEIPLSSAILSIEEEQNHAKLVRNYYDKIGKGSMFERKNVEDYLRSLGPTSLKRADISSNESFDEEMAQEKHTLDKNMRSMINSADVQFNKDQEDVRLIFEKLAAITPRPNLPTDPPTIMINDVTRQERNVSTHVYTEIPPVPEFGENISAFEEYISLLTNANFHHKQSSKMNGIIPKILKNFFHPLNSNIIPLRTTNSYNDVILYFSKKWNIATCRELLFQMKLENVKPNTTTFNIMLRSVSTHANIRHTAEPYKIIITHLDNMEKYNVKADVATWNIIFNLLKDDISKKLLLENRMLLGIPVDARFIRSVIGEFSLRGQISSRDMLETCQELDLPLNVKFLTILIRQLIQEGRIHAVWKIIENSKKKSIRTPIEQLDLLLVYFSNYGRVDLVVATLNTFRRRYKTKPSIESYNLVMKSIARARYWDLQLPVLRILYHQMMKDTNNCVGGEYWIRRARSRLSFIYDQKVKLKPDLTSEEIKLQDEIKNIKWNLGQEIIDLTKEIPSEYLDAATKLGYNSPGKQIEPELFAAKKKKADEYRNRIGRLSIQKALVDRIPYSDDSYGALKKEMKERNIIS